jgi:hypothetical protein
MNAFASNGSLCSNFPFFLFVLVFFLNIFLLLLILLFLFIFFYFSFFCYSYHHLLLSKNKNNNDKEFEAHYHHLQLKVTSTSFQKTCSRIRLTWRIVEPWKSDNGSLPLLECQKLTNEFHHKINKKMSIKLF